MSLSRVGERKNEIWDVWDKLTLARGMSGRVSVVGELPPLNDKSMTLPLSKSGRIQM